MARTSAGLLLYRHRDGRVEVFLVHPGGPFWARKDRGVWSIPKGEVEPAEDLLAAAKREFEEETGFRAEGRFVPLRPARQPGGKVVYAWAVEGDCDPARLVSNTFTIEWPPHSGTMRSFPEIDRAAWFPLDAARERMLKGQLPFLDQLADLLAGGDRDVSPEPR